MSIIVPIRLERCQEDAALLRYSVRSTDGAVYLHCTGPAGTSPPTLATLDYLTHCLEPAASIKPCSAIYPLLPFLGWTVERLAAELSDVTEVVAAAEHAAEDAHQLLDQLNAARQAAGLPSLALTLTAGHAAAPLQQRRTASGAAQQQQQQQCCSRVIGGWESALQFRKVAVGGTFDRLHAGHRLLLAATALVATREVFVGITADQLLASKKGRALVAAYEQRQAAAVGYLRAVNPSVAVYAGPLSDPKEPPVAATDPDFDAIVVSEETVLGAEAINVVRAQRGFRPLTVVVVGLIYSSGEAAVKLSSTDLRLQEAAAAAAAAAGGRPGSAGGKLPPP